MSDWVTTGGERGYFYLGWGTLTACEGPERGPHANDAAACLMEWETLINQGCHGEALAVASRALDRHREEGDIRHRLHIARGLALWLSGRVTPGIGEIDKVLGPSTEPLTRARAFEALGLMGWRRQDFEVAMGHLDRALKLYDSGAYGIGSVRVLLKRAGLLRDAGQIDAAQEAVGEARVRASDLGRGDLLAEVRVAQCALYMALGRWQQASEQLGALATRRDGASPCEGPRPLGAGELLSALEIHGILLQGALGLVQGDLTVARDAVERARGALPPDGSDPRGTAECLLLASDFELAAGRADQAASAASEAQALFASLQESDGECRSRVRHAHALLAMGEGRLAVDEARRALKAAPRTTLKALSLLTLGRTLLRTRRGEAAQAFDQARSLCPDGPFAAAARLGRTLAGGSRPGDPEVTASLGDLESWGDRRIFSYCLSDVRDLCGASHAGLSVEPRLITVADPVATALVEAAGALHGSDEWKARWHAAMRAVGRVLPWWRAVLVGQPGWELRRDMETPQPLASEDLAVELAAVSADSGLIDLLGNAALRRHPTRVLHGLGAALLTPVGAQGILYVDVREESLPLPEHASGLLLHLGRLMRSILQEAGQSEPEEAASLLPDLLGRSGVMQELFRDLSLVAPLDVSVHIYGETGTGKEKVAHALHRLSRRREGPWVAVNAASLSDELFESELFGHVKGAFTGALADRRGYVVEAEGGTLFLDEVTDLSPRAQAKLLRFLQEREYRRVGETRLARADLRILTASNVPLEERVSAGLFRGDLMYRLTQTTLAVPPLRERGDDILLLARHFLRLEARRAEVPVPALGQDAAGALLRHPWPGNVRELESELLKALTRAGTGSIGREHLSPALFPRHSPRASLKQSVQAFERAEITRALRRHNGNRTRAAWDLGLSRQALLAKITRLGIACPHR